MDEGERGREGRGEKEREGEGEGSRGEGGSFCLRTVERCAAKAPDSTQLLPVLSRPSTYAKSQKSNTKSIQIKWLKRQNCSGCLRPVLRGGAERREPEEPP